ncbi:aminotransferase class I/II-fold pyridoxal phosphate-dependent enzyme [Bradyrhizobium sp.]|uniref:aminotransferase class I/II-fold pyridoxal phosphate-dependent enzyme n=1 Tax=Bradyrhizobium sp. TaxID=376 RepID=UPI001ED29E40|nr:aminotransferase class I/II-fold pyridoxal phosphate-dependent enzyme [Bradyrhizobium sp.]MBV9982402.1 aminotransferase class I/II-fold pyridoxal phosphate-dependent enzyme [Bradyrhizobium sp.]
MPLRLAERVARMKPSASIAAKHKVTELLAAGRQVVDFTIGEPDLETPPHIIEAALAAMRRGDTHYTLTAGTPSLREAVCRKLERDSGLTYSPEEVVVGCGAKQLIFEAFAATLNKGDEVIIPAPYWVSYPDIVGVNDGTPVVVECNENTGFKLTPAALEAALTPKTRWLILNSPNNPTGAVYSRDELSALAQVLRRHPDVWLMTDEIYEHLVYDEVKTVNPVQVDPALKTRTLVINGLSKAHAMTGWRVGYAAGPKEAVSAIAKLLGQSTSCASSISQAAAVAALEGDQSHVGEAAAIYKRRRNRMIELLNGTPGLRISAPAGAFYLYPSVGGLIGRRASSGQTLRTDLDVTDYLLDQANVAVMDGSAYGLSPYLRLSFATSLSAIEIGCAQIRRACEALF